MWTKTIARFLDAVVLFSWLAGLGCFGGLSAFWSDMKINQPPEAIARMKVWLWIGMGVSLVVSLGAGWLKNRLLPKQPTATSQSDTSTEP